MSETFARNQRQTAMLNFLAITCGFAIFISTASAAPTTQAVARSQAIAADLDHFVLEIKYHGPQDKPHYNLKLSVAYVGERKDVEFSPTLQINPDDAKAIFDHLATEGFLDSAIGVRDLGGNIPEPTGPTYTLTLRTEALVFTEDLGWSDDMIARLEKLKPALKGEASAAMERLIARLAGYRDNWHRPQLKTLDSLEVVKIAKGEIEQLKWPLDAIYRASFKEDKWTVLAWRVNSYSAEGKPRFHAGGFRLITIDKDRRVVGNLAGH
jgi:hypothetical protein